MLPFLWIMRNMGKLMYYNNDVNNLSHVSLLYSSVGILKLSVCKVEIVLIPLLILPQNKTKK